jgi:diguanylate cyclase (GGDEF)-like protein
LDKLLFETTLSNEASRLASFIDKREELLKEVSNLVYSLIDFSCLCLCMYENEETVFHYDIKESISEDELRTIQEYLLAPTMGSTKNVRKSFIIDSQPIDNLSSIKLLSRFSTTLVLNENCLGSISVFSVKKHAFTQESENIIQLLAKDFPMIIKLMLLYAETKRLSITDGLTGINNNRYFKEILDLEFERAKRYRRNLCLILIDVDHFKSINDTYGHLQGDIVLKELASILKQDIRKGDFVARYGGEEFAVITFDTDLIATLGVAEKIRQKIAEQSFETDHGILKVTISLGVASISDSTETIFDLIKRADQALYKAKNEGRNRSCIDTE